MQLHCVYVSKLSRWNVNAYYAEYQVFQVITSCISICGSDSGIEIIDLSTAVALSTMIVQIELSRKRNRSKCAIQIELVIDITRYSSYLSMFNVILL